ncbi:MAG TPA: NAD(+) synthase [Tepidisphaeraceae bacterium]|nr:NAD(+) synthase [Tepidisphaeraceae bacterium]
MPAPPTPFSSLYTHGYVRVCSCVPRLKVAAPPFNSERTIALAHDAAADHAVLAIFPEMGLPGYSCEDLFHQDALLDATETALRQVLEQTANFSTLMIVGAPLRHEARLFNCAVVIHRGRILGVVPKTFLPNYREFYEKRQFASAADAVTRQMPLLGQDAPFGADLIFDAVDLPGFALHVEICEDLWTPIPTSSWGALAGATVLANLSASNITIGKAAYRRELCASQSGRCVAAYLYTAAGQGESTTDLAWDGHAMIYENGNLLAESERFSDAEQRITADVDLDRLRQERMRLTSFTDSVRFHRERIVAFRHVPFEIGIPTASVPLRRSVARFPYVPGKPAERDERCFEAYNIQVAGLSQRLSATGIKKTVIGVSGGLDSTQALIVCCRTMDRLHLPRQNVLGYTMPGFATSDKTKNNAWKLMKSLGISAEEIDIRPAALQMLRDIHHPFARGENVHDVTFENVQAGQRTAHLFRLANFHNGLVVGTGDLSELALGWNTYGVGDQMSHYNVNASVPKTLVQHLIRWEVDREEVSADARAVLTEILDTEISPELVPATGQGAMQKSEESVGPYELQDFHLYYTLRYGFRPSKVAFLALDAWQDRDRGLWPPGYPAGKRTQYTLPEIKKWLRVFLVRFFATSQFKRSAMPNAPKVGSGGSLSPRSDWRAPSDSDAQVWLDELEQNVP